jgi:hypothetical protein
LFVSTPPRADARGGRGEEDEFNFQIAKPLNVKIVIASEAKQFIGNKEARMDCFVASLLAMTPRHTSTFSRRISPEVCQQIPALSNHKGAGNAGRPMRPPLRVRRS